MSYLAILGKVDMKESHRLMGDIVVVDKPERPQMKYLPCRESDLGSLTAKTNALSKLPGVDCVTTMLHQERLFATKSAHSLIQKQIQKLE